MTTASPYDTVAYPSDSYRLTHPERLACQGRLFGLAAADPQRCRYLELGCGSGTNLLGMAVTLPGSQFLGIDLAAAPINEARRHAAELQLANISFVQGDISEAGAGLGEFDYIAAHGVFSWVPLDVRHALLELCAGHLSGQGVAYISYNAYPGCHIRQMVREMLQFHVRSFTDPQKRREQSRSLLRFLVAAGIAEEPYRTLLRSEARRVAQAPIGLTIHDDLADINQPYYFHEFVALAQEHRLQFLAEAELSDMSGLTVAAEVRPAFQALDSDLLEKEQYLDFMRGRYFRQTLLCPGSCPLERAAAPRRAVGGMLVTCDATIEARAASDLPGNSSYRRGEQLSITLSSLVANTLVQGVIAAWPAALTFAQIQALITARHPGAQPGGDDLAAMIWELARTGLIELRVGPPPCTGTVLGRPCASRFARWQARTSRFVTNLHHEMVTLEEPLECALIQLLDGTRTLTEAGAALVASGAVPAPPGSEAASAAAPPAPVEEGVTKAIGRFRRLALLQC